MPLLNGNAVHPYFPWYGRTPGAGAMLALCSVYRVGTPSILPTDTWDPWDPAHQTPTSPQTTEEIYRGRARFSPNQDWRARQTPVTAQTLVDFAMRIQIDFDGNVLPGHEGEMMTVGVGDWVRARSVVALQGQAADDVLTKMNYVVRNISSSSMSWQKTLLCDVIPNNLAAGVL